MPASASPSSASRYLEDGIDHTEMLRPADPSRGRGRAGRARPRKYNPRPLPRRAPCISPTFRRHRHRRRPCRHRGGARRGAHGCVDAAPDPFDRDPRPDELQSVDRRHWQGSSGEGDRCPRRCDGQGGRRSRNPLPHPERLERASRSGDACAGGSGAVQGGDSAPSWRSSRTSLLFQAACDDLLVSRRPVAGVVTASGGSLPCSMLWC